MKDYDQRITEETEKFAHKHKLQYKDVQDLVAWVEWTSAQEENKRIVNLITAR